VTIEEYLRELRAALRVGPLRKRRILQEVEGHLREAAHVEGSEDAAIKRFGTPDEVASRFAPRRKSLVLAALATAALGLAGGLAYSLTSASPPHGVPAAIKVIRRQRVESDVVSVDIGVVDAYGKRVPHANILPDDGNQKPDTYRVRLDHHKKIYIVPIPHPGRTMRVLFYFSS
jgi:type II secretory pathway component HofQ